MYYPKSQIKTNQYTKGDEYVILKSNTPYTGYYFTTSRGEAFSGKNPNESPSYKLRQIQNQTTDTNIESFPDNYYVVNDGYYTSKGLSTNRTTPTPPQQTFPVLNEQDYKLGEFQRYFLKKTNEPKFLEISKNDYYLYTSKNTSVFYELYTPIQISWIISGNKDQVYQVNKNIVAKAERERQLYGFTQYFRDNFTQFYK